MSLDFELICFVHTQTLRQITNKIFPQKYIYIYISTSSAFNPRGEAQIIQHSLKPSNLLTLSHVKPFSVLGECALAKGQIGHNP